MLADKCPEATSSTSVRERCIQLTWPAAVTDSRGRGGSEDPSVILAELLREDRHPDLGGGCHGSPPRWGLQRGACGSVARRGTFSKAQQGFDYSCAQRLMGASLLVFLNKTDIPGCMTVSDVQLVGHFVLRKSMNTAELWQALGLAEIKTHRWRIVACSAITGANIQEGLRWVIADAKERMFLY